MDEDFACFIVSDSESNNESDSDSSIDEYDIEYRTTPNVTCEFTAVTSGLQINGYYDEGDPSYLCENCEAYLWYGERLNKRVKKAKPIFSMCCKQGRVQLPKLKTPPNTLSALLYNHDDRSDNFRDNIRAYNMMFSFTSLGGKINHSINNGRGPYVFQMCGENYHRIGDILPEPGEKPTFLQLYIHDVVNEVPNRINAFGTSGSTEKIRQPTVELLKRMLDSHNPHVQAFRSTRERFDLTNNVTDLRLRIPVERTADARTHNLPTCNEVAGLIPGEFNIGVFKRDIVIESRSGGLQRISELHPAYLPLQYPLLFPYGEDGYRLGIDIGFVDTAGRTRKTVSMREFYAFRIFERYQESSTIVMSGKLYQQFLVDAFTTIESNRLKYISMNQNKLQTERIDKIVETVNQGNEDLAEHGKRIYIPSSFTGGKRYMMQHYLDAMATCKYYGFPDIFITITCNPKWPEVVRYLTRHGLKQEDRPDICCRVFKMKLDRLIEKVTKEKTFGVVNSAMYTIEFQKRGLPHAHMILFLHPDYKMRTPEDIGRFISAEIPDKELDKYLYEVVSDVMIHGPCGIHHRGSVCMNNGTCTKFFPKPFMENTVIDDVGYPIYKRRKNGRFVHKKGFDCDNSFVIPYNWDLSIRYRAHINVEWCNQSRSVKYLFKYIIKGPDYIRANIGEEDDQNEIKRFYNYRYVSACEAVWRILAFPICYRSTPVEKLSFHLPGQELVVYNEDDPIANVMKRSARRSKLLAWMECNKNHPEGRSLTYAEFPNMFVWINSKKIWKPRSKRRKSFAVGRITYVPPSIGPAYYLRGLLNTVPGATSFVFLKTVKGKLYKEFKDACFALGLLDDDKEYILAIKEASMWCFGSYLRKLFVILLLSKSLSVPLDLWVATKDILCEDIVYLQRNRTNNHSLMLSQEQITNLCLAEIEMIMRSNGSSLSTIVNMPKSDQSVMDNNENRLLIDERNYMCDEQRDVFERLLRMSTDEQRSVYLEIIEAVNCNKGGMFFVHGFGGTGKTFLWSILGADIRSRDDIVLNVASSGIAALLMEGGRTAHSRFCIPIHVDEFTICSIDGKSHLAELIRETKLIIWDEAPMMNKFCFETLDRSMRDIMKCDRVFGGKVFVLGGDFRQILPVVPEAGRVGQF